MKRGLDNLYRVVGETIFHAQHRSFKTVPHVYSRPQQIRFLTQQTMPVYHTELPYFLTNNLHLEPSGQDL